jgi:hypothetical protein
MNCKDRFLQSFPCQLALHQRIRFRSVYGIAASLLFLGLGATAVVAQSTDRDTPTPISSSILDLQGRQQQNQTFYYSFTAGPGELTVTLDIDAGSTNGNGVVASYSIQNRDGGPILAGDGYATPGMPSRTVKRVTFRNRTPLILVVNLPPGATADYSYTLKLGGAAHLSTQPRPLSNPLPETPGGVSNPK